MTRTELPRQAFGPTGVQVPKVGLGTWYLEQADDKTAVAAVQAALELGLTHVDTAELYGSGKAESLVGQALEGRRDGVFLVSKIIPSNASRKGTIKHCEQTLKRLRTDHLDCYLILQSGRKAVQEFCLTRVIESTPKSPRAEAVLRYLPIASAPRRSRSCVEFNGGGQGSRGLDGETQLFDERLNFGVAQLEE